MSARPRLSVIIPVRQTKEENRGTERLKYCLGSLSRQTIASHIEIIVSDTDSGPGYRKAHSEIAKTYKARYIYTKTGQPWNISRARNIGIRAARAPFVMVTDMDCVFTPSFLEIAMRSASEGSIVHCRICDLPEGYSGSLEDWKTMAAVSSMRPAWCYGGCQIVSRRWIESVRGYDEKYILWGADDNDLFERAVQSGKKSIWIEKEASYFHIWHTQDNRTSNIEQKEKNRARFHLTEAKRLPIVRNPRGWGMEEERNEWDDTAIIVTTFMRDKSLERTLLSIRLAYPTIKIVVADNGEQSDARASIIDRYECDLVAVKFDSGVTVARNAAVKSLPKGIRYVVICEDDIGFTDQNPLRIWRDLLDHESDAGIAGGQLNIVTEFAGGSVQSYEGTLSINSEEKTAYLRRNEAPEWRDHKGIKYHFTDIVLNVFMARRETLDAVPWDENIKSAPEHCDFFFSLKFRTPESLKAKRVIFTPAVALIHYRDVKGLLDANYKAYRSRPGAFCYFADKWGVEFYWNSWHPKWGMKNPQPLREYAEESTQSRQSVFLSAASVLDLLGAKWWLEAGTCLGAIREKDFIAHDTDIDIGVWTDRIADYADQLSAKMSEAGFAERKRWLYEGQLTEVTFMKADTKVDVFFFFERAGMLWHGAFGPENVNGLGAFNRFLPHVFTRRLFVDLKEMFFCGIKVRVPNPPEQYLEERYGADWKTPNREYRYWIDCKAVAPRLLSPAGSKLLTVGTWDGIHFGHIDHIEKCRALAESVTIGVLSDEAASLANGARPRFSASQRLAMVKSLSAASGAFIVADEDPTQTLKELRIGFDYIVHGDSESAVSGASYIRETGGRPLLLSTIPIPDPASSFASIKAGKEKRVISSGIEYAVGIKTFLRETTLERTVRALESNIKAPYRLYICDDSGRKTDRKLVLYQDVRKRGGVIIEKPYDTGISAGRNAIIKAVSEPYLLLTDDDVMIDDDESLTIMRAVLDARSDIGLVAALIRQEKSGQPFASEAYARGIRFERIGGLLKRTPMRGPYEKAALPSGGETIYRIADQVPNCFLARSQVFTDIRWDERIKVEYEHMDFFLRLAEHGKWKAAVAVEALATHYPSPADLEYERARRSAPLAYFKQKHGIDNIVQQFG